MLFHRFTVEGLAHHAFLLVSDRTQEAVVIDPRRDIDLYVQAAARAGARLAHAVETHIHADFVSGARELVEIGATCWCGPGSDLGYPHREVADGDVLEVGEIRLRFLHTPGHTPEHISILVEAPGHPARVFTGDTLFVGAVGRPDLLGDEWKLRLAGDLYDSLFGKLLALDDAVEVHPAHGAGSLCGKSIGSRPESTIGFERTGNPMLQIQAREAFVAAVLGDLPETPSYFPRMKRINREGPAVLDLGRGIRLPGELAPEEALELSRAGAALLDLRPPAVFAREHARASLNASFGARMGYYAAWVLAGGTPIVLLPGDDTELEEATRQLLRVGLDEVRGYVPGGFDRWADAGLPTSVLDEVPAEALGPGGERPRIIDVRSPAEWRAGHIEGALHIPLDKLAGRLDEVPLDEPLAIVCESGQRSSLAASLLVRAGAVSVANVVGGMAAYRSAAGASR